MKEFLNQIKTIPRKQKIIIVLFLIICVSGAVIYTEYQKFVNSQKWNENVAPGNEKQESGKVNEKQKTYTYSIYKPLESGGREKEKTEITFPIDENGYVNALIGGLKTSADHENNILFLMSYNPEKEYAVFNILEPRTRFNDWKIDPQQTAMSSELMKAVSDEIGIEIHYYGTMTSDGLSSIVKDYVSGFEQALTVNGLKIKDVSVIFDLLTKNKGSLSNMENIKGFLEKTGFDGGDFFYNGMSLFGEPGKPGNNFTVNGLCAFICHNLKNPVWPSDIPVLELFHMYSNDSNLYYDIVKETDENGKEVTYGKLSNFAIKEIQESLKFKFEKKEEK